MIVERLRRQGWVCVSLMEYHLQQGSGSDEALCLQRFANASYFKRSVLGHIAADMLTLQVRDQPLDTRTTSFLRLPQSSAAADFDRCTLLHKFEAAAGVLAYFVLLPCFNTLLAILTSK